MRKRDKEKKKDAGIEKKLGRIETWAIESQTRSPALVILRTRRTVRFTESNLSNKAGKRESIHRSFAYSALR